MGYRLGWLGAGVYCLGLFWVSWLVRHQGLALDLGMGIAAVGLLGAGTVAALGLPRRWRRGPTAGQWLMLSLVGLVAVINYGLRYPAPGPLDVSRVLESGAVAAQQEVTGQVRELPRTTRSGRGQLWLTAHQYQPLEANGQPLGVPSQVTGQIYITLPANQIEGIYPGQQVRVQGRLYTPQPPKNPNAFDFRRYLADRNCFAGLLGERVIPEPGQQPPRWKLWQLRQRIAEAHRTGLGSPVGPLVSAMALGRQAVQVPYDLQDLFVRSGMAHTLAASGFHVSLLLGGVLAVLGRPGIEARLPDPARDKCMVGGLTLGTYLLLTGGQPSVMRATVMGFGVLVGLALDRRVRPLGCLLVAVTLLLLVNPGWIDDVGFRLSVMATLGLMVAAGPIAARLDWLPTTLAAIAAVPLAAYLWTVPLSLYYFNSLTTYSVLLNMVATPLVMVISLGGMISGALGVVWPGLGAAVAWGLGLPAHLLIALVRWQVGLPGSTVATGQIALGQMLALYGLFCLWGWGSARRRTLVAVLIGLVALGPLLYRGATLAQVTVLAAGDEAVMVVQDGRSPWLINSGSATTARYTVAPFLRQAGINRLAGAVYGSDDDGDSWQTIAETTDIQHFYRPDSALALALPGRHRHRLAPGHPQRLGGQQIDYLQDGESGLRLSLLGQYHWLLLPKLPPDRQLPWLVAHPGPDREVLWWHGEALTAEAIAILLPQVAIASARTIHPETEQRLQAQGVRVFCTERDGAILWSPGRGYRAYLTTRSPHTTGMD
jgi:competence protein ComEC